MNSKPETRNAKPSSPSAREIAFQALQNWESRGLEIQKSLEKQFKQPLEEVEKALSQELAYGVIRWKLLLDEVIRQYSKRDPHKISKSIGNILRLGLYQLLHMDRIPEYAVVDESVKLAKNFCKGNATGFVNAVLREFLRKKKAIALPENDPVSALSISTSHPLELVQRWVKLWGIDQVRILCEAGNTRPRWVLRTNLLKTTRSALVRRLKGEGLEVAESPEHRLAIRLKGTYPLARLESFREGLFQVQDESMQKVIDELELEPHLKVLDLCSAPGTKATAMAERMLDQGMILALDRSLPRMFLLLDNMRRLGIHSIRSVIADARLVQSISRTSFDRILVDAPCSNTGVLNRRVEARWRFSLSDLKRLSNLQMEILEAALKVMKPGGLLVYSTCSIDPSENEELVQRVLKGKSDVELLTEQTFFPTEAQGGGYWAKIKKSTLKGR